MLWLYIEFPSLFADSVEMGDDCFSGLIVVDQTSRRVLQTNFIAEQAGITKGISISEANALIDDLTVVTYRYDQEVKRLHELAQWLYQKVANISLNEPSGLAIEVSGMMRFYGGLDGVVNEVKTLLFNQKVRASLATGFTPLAAQALAKSPHPVICADHSNITDCVSKVDIEFAPFEPNVIEQLSRMGLKKIGDVLNLPARDLTERFGQSFYYDVKRLAGLVPDLQIFYEPPERYERCVELSFHAELIRSVQFIVRRLLEQFELYLTNRQFACHFFTLFFLHADYPPTEVRINLSGEERRVSGLMSLVLIYLDKTKIPGPIVSVGIRSGRFNALSANTQTLLEDQNNSTQKPEQLISYLKARLGDDAVYGLSVSGDHRPEFSSTYAAVSDSKRPHNVKLRPSIILNEPEVLTSEVKVLDGPERIQAGWWDGNPVSRDYFVARNNHGQNLWIYKEEDGTWYVHGYFA